MKQYNYSEKDYKCLLETIINGDFKRTNDMTCLTIFDYDLIFKCVDNYVRSKILINGFTTTKSLCDLLKESISHLEYSCKKVGDITKIIYEDEFGYLYDEHIEQ